MINHLEPLIGKLSIFAKERMGFEHPPKLFLKNNHSNAEIPLGRTAHYDPNQESITLFITNRHPKDILRSLAHELVHHTQNLRGDLTPEKMTNMGKNYAQDDEHMRNMEKEAYLVGNMCFRDWEDGLDDEDTKKYKLAESRFLKENKTMTTKITKDFLRSTIRKLVREQQDMSMDTSTAVQSKTILGALGKFPTKGAGRYGVIPDLKAAGSFSRAYRVARQMDIPYFSYPGKYSVYASGIKGKPQSLEDIQEAWKFYYLETDSSKMPKGLLALRNETIEAEVRQSEMFSGNLENPASKEEVDKAVASAIEKFEQDRPRLAVQAAVGDPLADLGIGGDDNPMAGKGQVAMGDEAGGTQVATVNPANLDKKTAVADEEEPPLNLKREAKEELEENEELEEKKSKKKKQGKYDDNDGVDERCDYVKCDESKIQTPEQENTIYEQRFTPRNTKLFEKLLKEWTK